MRPSVPEPHPHAFAGGIAHPALYLWDAWSYVEGATTHLYCLAVSRWESEGQLLDPVKRNERPFHVRYFVSQDGGTTWADRGCFQQPRIGTEYFDSRTIWSGSVKPLPDGSKLVAYTGLRDSGPELLFQQSIGLAMSRDGSRVDRLYDEPISCSLRDWEAITETGYYLDQRSRLGHRKGEEGGPIMSWRDPFIFLDDDNQIHLFWGAKVASHRSALAHALVERDDSGFRLVRLFEPVVMPDGDEFTQLELPKVLHDQNRGRYYLVASTCNRLFENQRDDEVDKRIRLYTSSSLRGPWLPGDERGSTILRESKHMFGPTVLDADYRKGELRLVAPYTDAADDELKLTLSTPFVVSLPPAR